MWLAACWHYGSALLASLVWAQSLNDACWCEPAEGLAFLQQQPLRAAICVCVQLQPFLLFSLCRKDPGPALACLRKRPRLSP